MNKKKTIIAIVLGCAMLAGCGENQSNSSSVVTTTPESTSDSVSEKSISDKTAQLQEELEFPSMVAVKEDNLEVYFGLTKDDVTEYSAYICGSGAAPDEFGIFIAKDENAASKIKDCLENRVESQKKTFEDYPLAANEMYKLDDCFVSVNGTTVTYAICANNNRAKDILG